MVDHAIFSKDGPNLNNPAETKRPSVIPNKYRLKNRNAKGRPSFSKDIPNNGEVNSIAGTVSYTHLTLPTSDLV